MKTSDYEWWDLQAAEYVLGTLADNERLEFENQLDTDEDLQQLVVHWQTRLDPLHLTTQPVTPPAHVLQDIHTQLNTASHNRTQRSESDIDTIDAWRRKARLWQLTAIASLAAAAVVAGVLLFRPAGLLLPPSAAYIRPVAILQNADSQPIWVVNYRKAEDGSKDTGELYVSVVGQPKKDPHQSHQLWMVLPEGTGVQSVGMIPDEAGESSIIRLPIPLAQAAELAVSIEDNGEVPGPEHGPVVARTFIINAGVGI